MTTAPFPVPQAVADRILQDRIEQTGDQLRAKIANKFSASAFLGGFALTIFAGQVFALFQSAQLPMTFAPAIGAVFTAGVLYVAAIVKLDELTMPKRFWKVVPDPTKPQPMFGEDLTTDDLCELRTRMVFFWNCLTIVATALTFAAVLTMLVPLAPVASSEVQKWSFRAVGAALLALVVYAAVLVLYARRTFRHLVKIRD